MSAQPPPVGPLSARSDHACFGCGDRNPIGLHLQFVSDGVGVTATFAPMAEHQGFHDVVHGGIISTVLDEAMAWAVAAAGIWAVTGEMSIRFRRPLPVGAMTTATARVTTIRGRLIEATGELVDAVDGAIYASSTGKFITVDRATATDWESRYRAPEAPATD